MLVPAYECKETLKKYEELSGNIWELIRPITNNSYNYDEKYVKLKFDSDDDVSIKKTLVVSFSLWGQEILSEIPLRWMFVEIINVRIW